MILEYQRRKCSLKRLALTQIITARKRSLRRLCFYTCLFVHRGVCVTERGSAWQGACVAGGHAWQGACMVGGAWWGGMHGRGGMHDRGGMHGRGGGHVWWGACMAGGMYSRGCVWWEDMHGRGCVVGSVHDTHANLPNTTRYSQWADSTHPTGMHSCFRVSFILILLFHLYSPWSSAKTIIPVLFHCECSQVDCSLCLTQFDGLLLFWTIPCNLLSREFLQTRQNW